MDRKSFGGVMRVGSLVTWKYTKDKLFVVVAMDDLTSIRVRSVKTGLIHDMFKSDLEVVCK